MPDQHQRCLERERALRATRWRQEPSIALARGSGVGCWSAGCGGRLGPWGHARPRRVLIAAGRDELHRPRRARCRACRRTQVLLWARRWRPARTRPPRPQPARRRCWFGLAATSPAPSSRGARPGRRPCGSRGPRLRPAGPSRRLRRRQGGVGSCGPIAPAGSELGDMLEAVGQAVAACIRRVGPIGSPWQLGVVLTSAGILAPRPSRSWRASVE